MTKKDLQVDDQKTTARRPIVTEELLLKKQLNRKKEDISMSKLERIFRLTFLDFLFVQRQKMLTNILRV